VCWNHLHTHMIIHHVKYHLEEKIANTKTALTFSSSINISYCFVDTIVFAILLVSLLVFCWVVQLNILTFFNIANNFDIDFL